MTERKFKTFLALVHSPINNKHGEEVITSVTNLDVHDIARSCRTFGLERYYIVTPLKAQHELLERLLKHWETDEAGEYNPDRQNALSLIKLVNSVEEAQLDIENNHQSKPFVVATGAKIKQPEGTCKDLLKRVEEEKIQNVLILFGTGHGMAQRLLDAVDFRLERIVGASRDGYNHLSVRSAVAIYCDRLFG
jgi:hypothetical protein